MRVRFADPAAHPAGEQSGGAFEQDVSGGPGSRHRRVDLGETLPVLLLPLHHVSRTSSAPAAPVILGASGRSRRVATAPGRLPAGRRRHNILTELEHHADPAAGPRRPP